MLKVQKISHAFGENVILENVNFEATPGEIIGLVAPNGTGKTTLLNILMNFINPQDGKVTIEKEGKTLDYSTINSKVEMHKNIIFLPELEDLYGQLTGLDHLELYAKLWGETSLEVSAIIEKLNIDSYVHTRVSTYSLGMRQRLCFAMLLCANPPIMLMDEVMNGLDPDNVTLLTEILIDLKNSGKVILIASHLLDNLDIYADRILFMKDAQLTFLDVELTKQTFIKIKIENTSEKELKKQGVWTKDARLFGEDLLALPTKDLADTEIANIVSKSLKAGHSAIQIDQVGTQEWYDEFYS